MYALDYIHINTNIHPGTTSQHPKKNRERQSDDKETAKNVRRQT